MINPVIDITILSFIGSVTGLIGGVFFLLNKKSARLLSSYAVPFAAGVLLSVSLLHLLPESVHEIGESAYFYILIALLASFFFEQFFVHLHHHEESESIKNLKSSTPLVIVGDTIHNFIDGVAIASAYMVEPKFGLVVALATFLHETPHEIGDFGVLISTGMKRSKVFIVNLLSALATFPGAFLTYLFFAQTEKVIGILLAIASGIFLYLGASDFLPQIGHEKKGVSTGKKFVLLVSGALIMYAFTFISPKH